MSAPTFELDADGYHVWFRHQCVNGPDESKLPRSDTKRWDVTNSDPLSVLPSIDCSACGTHGFITDGRWVPV